MHKFTIALAALATVATGPAWADNHLNTDLADTQWRLVRIMEMDDSTHVPDDEAKYTLAFGADGTVSILADCNRGAGTWQAEGPSQLQFGPIAATQALCPPESISEVYLAQFQWVRSYTMRDGHLFLATMADGSIIEFAPVAEAAVAMVHGEKLYTTDPMELQSAILTPLFDHYAAEHDLDALEAEVDHYVENMEKGMRAMGLDTGDDLTAEEKAEMDATRREMGAALIRQWKINRALYDEYGGRIIYQQMGPEPLDAYRAFLQSQCEAGAFEIMDPDLEAAFWRYFTDESIHDFMAPDSADAQQAFSVPPWERKASD
jgi:heat shock protein HslJ